MVLRNRTMFFSCLTTLALARIAALHDNPKWWGIGEAATAWGPQDF